MGPGLDAWVWASCVPFLPHRHDHLQIRRIAVENVLSLTTEEEDRRLLREFDAVTQLCRIVGDLSVRGVRRCRLTPAMMTSTCAHPQSIAGDALKCLINLSDDPIMLNGMLKAGVVGKVMESLGVRDHLAAAPAPPILTLKHGGRVCVQGEFKHKKLAIQLLLNITRLPSGAKEVKQRRGGNEPCGCLFVM